MYILPQTLSKKLSRPTGDWGGKRKERHLINKIHVL